MTTHSLATALIPFYTGNIAGANQAIDDWNKTATARLDAPAIKLIHFASASTVEVSNFKSYIIIELTADAPAREALRLFAVLLKDEMAALLIAAGVQISDPIEKFLPSKSVRLGQSPFVKCGLTFDGSPEMSVRRIKFEDQLAKRIEDKLTNQKTANLPPFKAEDSPAQKFEKIRKGLWQDCVYKSDCACTSDCASEPDCVCEPDCACPSDCVCKPDCICTLNYKPAFVPQPTPILNAAPPGETLLEKLRIFLVILYRCLIWPLPLLPSFFLLFALLPRPGGWLAHILWPFLEAVLLLVIALVTLTVVIRQHEIHDPVTRPRQKRQDADEILKRENQTSQNILSTISILKPGLARRLTLQLVFYVIRTVLPLYWAPGRLGDLNDIHFMRWLLLPCSNVLIFRSHYDGAWVNYIEDFALRAPQGVTAIWSNTQDFPLTQWLTQGGAADGPRFRQWVHTQTRPVFFTYSAYPTLSMERIRLNARIAHAITTGVLDDAIKNWLTSLGDADGGDF